MKLSGVLLPIITPFADDEVDYKSYKLLIDYYISKGISGIIPLGTTGEGPTISSEEFSGIIEKTIEYVDNRVPIYVGLGGNNTLEVIKKLKSIERYKIDGILSVCPYYNRPDQRGIYEHFTRLSEAANLDIIVYNIPYRTGRNIENDTIRRLSEHKNIIGLKDSCGDIKQTTELLMDPPNNFSILTGEDALFYTALTMGAHGGILASSHLKTETFIDIYNKIISEDISSALELWKEIYSLIPLLFAEPNPAPIKYCLKKIDLIASDEVRLPLMNITNELAEKLNKYITIRG